MAQQPIRIELKVDGKDQVRGDFIQVGQAGEEAFNRIQAAAERFNEAGRRAGSVGEYIARGMSGAITANRKLIEGMSQAGRVTQKTTVEHEKLSISFKGVATALIPLIGGAGALAYLIQRNIDAAAAIHDTARAVGVQAETLQELRFAFGQLGVQEQQTDSALEHLVRTVGMARHGQGELHESLKDTNKELLAQIRAATTAEQAFDIVTAAIGGTVIEMDRAALASKAFGRAGGAEIAAALREGTDALDEQRHRARELGIILESDLLENADEAKRRMRELGLVLDRNVKRVVLELAPTVADLAEKLASLGPGIAVFLRQSFGLDEVSELSGELVSVNKAIVDIQRDIQEGPSLGDLILQDAGLARDPHEVLKIYQQRKKELEEEIRLALERREVTEAQRKAELEAHEAAVKRAEEERRLAEERAEAEEKAEQAAKDRERRHKSALDDIVRLEEQATKAGLDGVEALAAARDVELERYKQLLAEKIISEEEFARARLAIEETFHKEKAQLEERESEKEQREREREAEKQRREEEREAKRRAEEMSEFAREAARNMQDAFADFFFDPFREGLKGMVLDFLNALRRMAADLAASKLLEFLTGDFGKTGKLGGFVGDFLIPFASSFFGAGATGGAFSSATTAVTSQTGGVTQFFATAPAMHSGGIAGEVLALRSVPAQLFGRAPRLHSGGLAGDEVPAILRRGEEVLTRGDPRHRANMGRPRGVQINVNSPIAPIDARGATAEAAAVFFRLAPEFERRIMGRIEQLFTRGVL
jgi:hypothetical protein